MKSSFIRKLKKFIKIKKQSLQKFSEFSKISYSQGGEDILISMIFDTLGIQKPSYLDIGAHHPLYLSNTAYFYENGSRGINIEADPALIANFKKQRPQDINLNIGICDKNTSEEISFYIINEPTLNTFSKKEAESYSSKGNYKIVDVIKIPVFTVQNIVDKYYHNSTPDFLTLDAEGIDDIVIRSIDFDSFTPKVLCVETAEFNAGKELIKNKPLIKYIIEKGYFIFADTYNNTIFMHEETWKNKD